MTIREFKMPDVGEGLTEAEILKWYVQPGDTVTDGQVVCEVETAKAAVELPIPFDGVVHALLFEEGTTVDVGQVIISVQTGSGEAAEAPAQEIPAPAEAEEAAPAARQPVLVGYGVSESSTKRRPRKAPATAVAAQNGTTAPAAAAPRLPPPRWRPRLRRFRRSRPVSVRWPSRRCASSPRTSASTWPRWSRPVTAAS